MKNPKGFCSKCRQPFTRRWNANRHCNNKHSGYLESITSFTDYLINGQNSNHGKNFEEENNYNKRNFVKNYVFLDAPISSSNLSFNNNTYLFQNYLDQELLPYYLLSPLAPKYEELRGILDDVPEPSKTLLLGRALSSALNSENSVEAMQKRVTEYRKSKGTLMMLNDLFRVHGGNKEFTEQF